MKKTVIGPEKCVGKTVTDLFVSTSGRQWAIIFGDEILCIGIERGWDVGDEELIHGAPSREFFEDEHALAMGLVSEETIKEEARKKAAVELTRKLWLEKTERAQLAKLLEKYGEEA
jgi:hypothetical protein